MPYSRYFGWGKLKDSLSTKCSEHLKIASIKLDCLNLLKLSFAKCSLTCQHSPLSNFPLIWLMRHSIVHTNESLFICTTSVWVVHCTVAVGLFLSRSHTYHFDDFLASWMDRLKDGLDGEHTTVTVMLQKEVDKYQVLWLCIYVCVYVFL